MQTNLQFCRDYRGILPNSCRLCWLYIACRILSNKQYKDSLELANCIDESWKFVTRDHMRMGHVIWTSKDPNRTARRYICLPPPKIGEPIWA